MIFCSRAEGEKEISFTITPQQEPKKKAARRIQLTEDDMLDEMDLSEEDRIAAEIMRQNGNTVDYTA